MHTTLVERAELRLRIQDSNPTQTRSCALIGRSSWRRKSTNGYQAPGADDPRPDGESVFGPLVGCRGAAQEAEVKLWDLPLADVLSEWDRWDEAGTT
jgi:hypothetical protein